MKKVIGVFILFMVFIACVGCGSNNQELMGEVKKFADPMTEDILISLNNKDFEAFTKDLGDQMKSQVNQDFFNTQLLPMAETIGEYQEGSKELIKAENDKGYIQAIYNTKYSNEEGNVIITVVFTDDEENRKIEGFFMNSPKIQDMAK